MRPSDTPSPTEAAPTAISPTPPPAQENQPTQSAVDPSLDVYSNAQYGFCFGYPKGFTQMPYNDAVEVVGPAAGPGAEGAGLLWMEVRDPQGQTAQQVADQELEFVPGLNPDRSTVMLDGEEALVLDGMPGQDLVRRVYIVHQGALYILTFSPTRSENAVAGAQMEALFSAVTDSWSWSPCSGGS